MDKSATSETPLEKWRQVIIDDTPFPQQISDKGQIKCANGKVITRDEIIQKKISSYIFTRSGNNKKSIRLSQLFARTFVKNDDPTRLINVGYHDGNNLNFAADNLFWISKSDITKRVHADKKKNDQESDVLNIETLTINDKPQKDNPHIKAIHQYSLDGKYLYTHDSIAEACRFNNWDPRQRNADISKCCKGTRRVAHGFLWRLASEHPIGKDIQID